MKKSTDPAIRRLALTADDSEMCLDSARGLRKDARKCSDETALALLELSMEECVKGIMLILDRRFDAVGFDPTSASSLALVPSEELRDIYRRHAGHLTAQAVRDSFRWHQEKLKQLEFILEFYAYGLEHGLLEHALCEVLSKLEYPLEWQIRLLLLRKKDRARLTKATQEAIEEIRSLNVRELDDRKEQGLYVGLSEEGQGCVFPSVEPKFLEKVERAADLLIQLLEGMVVSERVRPELFSRKESPSSAPGPTA